MDDPTLPAPHSPDPERRRLVTGMVALWGGLATGLVVPFLRYFAAPLTVVAGSAGEAILPLAPEAIGETWTAVTLEFDASDAWISSQVRKQGAFVRQRGGTLEALSATCTHLGCQVNWDAATKEFLCPCHQGHYDADGRVTAGPPPGPLAALPIRIVEGRVVVGQLNGEVA